MKGIGKEFMRKTQYEYLDVSDQNQGLPQPPLAVEPSPEMGLIDLPDPATLDVPKIDLHDVITARRTLRLYVDEAITLHELSYLLWCTQGVKEVTNRPATLRTVPSAGARHAFETLLLVNNVEGLEPGLYRYFALQHKLAKIDTDAGFVDAFWKSVLKQKQVKTCAVNFIWTVEMYRMYWRYGERGYRYLHLDAGHVCQNLALAAEALDSGICPIAAFDDATLNELLGLDGEDRFVVYLATLGRKRPA